MREPTDSALVAGVLRGDDSAATLLFRRHARRAWLAARRICGDDHLADDALQEGFIRALRHLSMFDDQRPFGTWLAVIVANRCRRLMADRAASPEVALRHDLVASDVPGARADDRLAIAQALRGLSEDHRRVVLLREVAGYSTAETASMTGVSEGTVKSRLARAHHRLREGLLERHALD